MRKPFHTAWTLLALLLLNAACQSRSSPCQLALHQERYEDAATLCREDYEAHGQADSASAAARAHYFLGEYDAVFTWAERTAGTPAEARILALTAGIHHRQGNGAAERQALERSRDLFLADGDWGRAAWSLHGLAYQAWQDSHYREALEQAREAEDFAQRGSEPELQRLAGELQFSVLYAIGDLGGARRVLDRSRPLLEGQPRIFTVRWHHHEASLLLDGGRPALARAAALQALDHLEKAVDSYGSDPLLARSVHLNLVEISLRMDDLEAAQLHLDAAWSYAADGADRTALLFYSARVAARSARPRTAVDKLREALREDPVADWVWELELDLGKALEDLGEPVAAERSYRQSVAVVEELRSSLGLDDLKPWLLEKKRRPFEALFLLLVGQDRGREALEVAERARARSLLDSLLQSLDFKDLGTGQRLSLLESGSPLAASPPAPAFPQVVQVLRRGRMAIFFQAEQEVWRLVPRADRLLWHCLPWAADELEEKVESFLANVDDSSLAKELGNGLLPSQDLPATGGLLHLLPDGPLTRLPFAALRVDQEFLVERFSLVYLPSLTLSSLKASSLSRPHPRQRVGSEAGRSLIVGDPKGDLASARREAIQVASLLGGDGLRLGEQATLESFAAAGPLSLLHLATHTGLRPSGPWIALADGPVLAKDLLNSVQPPRLAVLAGCASAARPGREVTGSLAAAFLAAGTPVVLGTLRSVEDSRTLDLILRFYREGGRNRPVRALAQAQRSLAREGHRPSTWSTFVILGTSIHGEDPQDPLEL